MPSKIASFFFTLPLTVLISCGEPPQATPELIRPIAWMQAETSSLEQIRRLSGVVQAAEETELSFEVGGKVATVTVKLGDRVQRGQLLATLEAVNYTLSQRRARAQLTQAQAQLSSAQSDFERQSNLFERGFGNQAAVDNTRSALDSARSAVDAARADLALNDKNLQDTKLYAPYDGVIKTRTIEPSQQVVPGQTSFEIEGDAGLEISLLVPESLLENLDRSQQYATTFPAINNVTLTSRLNEIGTQAQAANAFPITLTIEGADERLKAGMSAEVDVSFTGSGIITGYTGDVVLVPPTALVAGAGAINYAFVYDPDTQTVSRREVLAENIIDNTVQVTQGLKAGDIIATAGVTFLYDGQKVRLLGDTPKIFN